LQHLTPRRLLPALCRKLYQLACEWHLLLAVLHPFGCKVRTSVKVTHFIPQTVVSTYVAPGGNPWQEMAFVSQTAGG
jgi:hypothetical protein